MTLFVISFLAGMLTVLAPCILPLLPIVIGASAGSRSKMTPYVVIGSLGLSILLFTYLLKATTAFIAIPPYVWGFVSGGILLTFGLILLFPKLWDGLSVMGKLSGRANQLVGAGYQKKSLWGDALIGAALGPVFSTCSPTYFVILATVLPASFFLGTLYLLAYIGGLALVLLLIALLGQKFTARLTALADGKGIFKKIIGAIFILLGIAIVMGWDKDLETQLLDAGYWGFSGLEERWLQRVDMVDEPLPSATERAQGAVSNLDENTFTNIPAYLQNIFPETDWNKYDPRLASALSGGPGKDDIPAIDEPKFTPLSEFGRSDSVQAVVMEYDGGVKVYPYNILTWHEIVNDEVGGVPVAITFCPLCGSAIVFDRTMPDGVVTTLGVSGSLLESNMIMYDRETESLWQQSTGETLAGVYHESRLNLAKFQLLEMGEVRDKYPNALVLSEDTGHDRDYGRNPYAGYETDNRFIFEPSSINARFPAKEIMVVARVGEEVVATPWQALREAGGTTGTVNGESLTYSVNDGELSITDESGNSIQFYFEMWFSFAAQHENGQVIEV